MAESTISGLVLDRREKSFIDKDTKEKVTYYDALIFDAEIDPPLTVFRSMDRDDLTELVPGETVKGVACRVEKRHSVPVTLVKSPRDGGEGVRF